MTDGEKKVFLEIVEHAADLLSNAGCDESPLSEFVDLEERRRWAKEMNLANHSPEELSDKTG